MVTDDRPLHPMTIPVVLEFRGELHREAFIAALRETLANHPLLRSHLDASPGLDPQWIELAEWLPPIDWDQAGVPLRFPSGEAIDLTRDTGLRLWVRTGSGRSTLTAQFHHASVDGAGTTQFFGELLGRYAARIGGLPVPSRPVALDPQSLRRRGTFTAPMAEKVSLARIVWATVAETAKFMIRRVAPMAVPSESETAAEPAGDFPAIDSHEFEIAETEALAALAKANGARVNDFLMRDLFQVVVQWNSRCGKLRPAQWLVVNMPKNMREAGDEAMPAANRMSYTFLTRRARETDDSMELLKFVRSETGLVRKYGLGLFFLGNIASVLAVPGMLKRLLGGERCFATTILSNFGNVSRQTGCDFPAEDGRLVIGNLRLERWHVAAPVRHLTRAAFAALTYAGRLTICLRSDPRLYSRAASRELLECYVARIKRTLKDRG